MAVTAAAGHRAQPTTVGDGCLATVTSLGSCLACGIAAADEHPCVAAATAVAKAAACGVGCRHLSCGGGRPCEAVRGRPATAAVGRGCSVGLCCCCCWVANCCSACRKLVVLISKTEGRFLICFAVVTNESLSGKSFSSGLVLRLRVFRGVSERKVSECEV